MLLPDIITQFDISISDGLLLYCLLPAVAFFLAYTAASPWWNVKKFGLFGIVTVLHSLSVVLLLFLIGYAIVLGQKVDEPMRVLISATLAFSLTSKFVLYLIERRRGVQERRRKRAEARR